VSPPTLLLDYEEEDEEEEEEEEEEAGLRALARLVRAYLRGEGRPSASVV
jgi:hypothetical protein